MTLYIGSVADQTDHIADDLFAKTLRTAMTLCRRYGVRKFTADTIFFKEIQCKKRDILMFNSVFSRKLCWNKVKDARITITHLCFIALTCRVPR